MNVSEFHKRVKVTESGCWEWQGRRHEFGYGKYGKQYMHRWAFENFVGEIPAGMHVCHRCDNPPCCNPAHLFVGTQTENIRDMAEKGRAGRGEKQPNAKLCNADVVAIRDRWANGVSQKELAAEFGITKQQICRVVMGHRWAHIDGPTGRGRRPWQHVTPEKVHAIQQMHASGMLQRDIGRRVGYTQQTVSRVLKRYA